MAFVPKYILILFALIIIDYVLAIQIENSTGKLKKIYFYTSLILTIGILFTFKYFNFFSENIHSLAQFLNWNYSLKSLNLILPLGLSFHTFQSLSYVIEVYRGKYKAEKHLGIYSLYVLFFPQLVAGPIERPEHLLPQLKQYKALKWANVKEGVRLMAWGFFKKLVVADRLAISVSYVYGHIGQSSSLSVFMSMIFFSFQLYADFSGYSDIARGSAKTLGIDVIRNFEQPYFSRNVAEFWRKWHISLSSWFRDYFYFPLAFSIKANKYWLYFCIFCTFVVTGLWHGAGWTFLVMGALHGIYISGGLVTKKIRDNIVESLGINKYNWLHEFIQKIITFFLVSFSWIFFRSPNMSVALDYIHKLFNGWGNINFIKYIMYPYNTLGITWTDLMISVGGIVFILIIEHIQNKLPLGKVFDDKSLFVRTLIYSLLFLSIFIFSIQTTEQFIYFQF